MPALIKYEAACRALAEAKSTDEVKDVRDKAEAIRLYGRQAKNKQLEIDATEIRIRAERRLGQMLSEQKESGGFAKGSQGRFKTISPTGGSEEEPPVPPTLAEVGISKKLSSRAQKIAAVPEAEFEGQVAEWRERVQAENERVTTNLIKIGENQQNKKTAANKQQPVKPDETEKLKGIIEEQREYIEELEEKCRELQDEVQSQLDITADEKQQIVKLNQLRAHIRALEAQRNDLMHQVNEWKKEAKVLRKKLGVKDA